MCEGEICWREGQIGTDSKNKWHNEKVTLPSAPKKKKLIAIQIYLQIKDFFKHRSNSWPNTLLRKKKVKKVKYVAES